VCLPLLIFPCTIKSRSSLLALAHPVVLEKAPENGCCGILPITFFGNYPFSMSALQISAAKHSSCFVSSENIPDIKILQKQELLYVNDCELHLCPKASIELEQVVVVISVMNKKTGRVDSAKSPRHSECLMSWLSRYQFGSGIFISQ